MTSVRSRANRQTRGSMILGHTETTLCYSVSFQGLKKLWFFFFIWQTLSFEYHSMSCTYLCISVNVLQHSNSSLNKYTLKANNYKSMIILPFFLRRKQISYLIVYSWVFVPLNNYICILKIHFIKSIFWNNHIELTLIGYILCSRCHFSDF